MSKAVWGPATWRFLHTLAAKIREEDFAKIRPGLIECITRVCDVLPCPECRGHAMSNLRRAVLTNITEKAHLIEFLFQFHNLVNQQTRKPIATTAVLQQYETIQFEKVLNDFAAVYSTSTRNVRLMSDTFHRNRFLSWLRQFLLTNGKSFNK